MYVNLLMYILIFIFPSKSVENFNYKNFKFQNVAKNGMDMDYYFIKLFNILNIKLIILLFCNSVYTN